MMAYEEIRLVKPSLGLKDKALEYRQEHFDFGEQIINGSELFDKIASYGVMSTPGLVVNGKVVSAGKVLKADAIVELLEKNL